MEEIYCVAPFEPTPPAYIGGTGGALTVPTPPSGTWITCRTNQDCAATDAGSAAARICVSGLCEQCAADVDCPQSLPTCFRVRTSYSDSTGYTLCRECGEDKQCPAERPHCRLDGQAAGTCVACLQDKECPRGICAKGTCTDQCTSDSSCPDPAKPCSENHRCEFKVCSDDSNCGKNLICNQSFCRRKDCGTDADCRDGFCVNGRCHEDYGTCAWTVGYP